MENPILSLFLYNKKLRFNEIEKQIGERSNKLAYHLKLLIKKGVIEKTGEFYHLTETSETLIPFLSKKTCVLPVILIAIPNPKSKNKIFLHQRTKRPFEGKFSLPGGRIIMGETLKQATKRLMKEKFNINATFKKINSISLEQVKKKRKTIHSFLLLLVTASTKEEIKYITPKKSKTISSDYNLIKNDLNKKIKIKKLITLS
jgi:ADP-ribose pyrophosphatase YjhB (NUDIX family)